MSGRKLSEYFRSVILAKRRACPEPCRADPVRDCATIGSQGVSITARCFSCLNPCWQSRRKLRARIPPLLLAAAVFGNVHDLVLVNEQVGHSFARQPHHVLVIIFNPSAHGLTIHQLDADRLLLLPQGFEEASFFKSLLRRRRPPSLGGIRISLRAKRHDRIVHKVRKSNMSPRQCPYKQLRKKCLLDIGRRLKGSPSTGCDRKDSERTKNWQTITQRADNMSKRNKPPVERTGGLRLESRSARS